MSESNRKNRKGAFALLKNNIHRVLGTLFVAVWILLIVLVKAGVVSENSILVFFHLADKPASNAEMSVHFVDVGQGDCEIIICNGEACLIDCGEPDMKNRVISYLKAQNITEIRYFIISHQHTDHMGCAEDVLEHFDVDCVIMPSVPDELLPTNNIYDSFLDSLESHDIPLYMAEEQTLTLGGCELFLYPQSVDCEYDTLNAFSICVKAVHGDNSFLFCGDATADEEQQLIDSGFNLSAKIVKINHHGSAESSSEEFLKAVGADYAVIEVGAGNSYGHPSVSAVKRIEKHCRHLYRTDINGTVVFESDGEGLNVLKDK